MMTDIRNKKKIEFYYEKGTQFKKDGKLDDAINAYKKALELDPSLMQVHNKIAYLYQKKGWLSSRFYSINHRYKIIYCMIPKNATTLFKMMMIENSNYYRTYQKSSVGVHKYIRDHDELKLTDFSYLKNQEYFKFVILRNPFERLVSAYYDKFVKQKRANYKLKVPVINVIKAVYMDLGLEADVNQSITFSQFIKYLTRMEDFKLDCHWRPQYTFFMEELLNFDFIGQFENLDSVIEFMEKKFGFNIGQSNSQLNHSKHAKHSHVTQYGSFESYNDPCNMYPKELCSLDSFPKAKQLYTSELEELVRARYARDIEIYECKFNVSLKI